MRLFVALITGIVLSAGAVSLILSEDVSVALGAVTPFTSKQLAPSPSNGDCLTTDGTNNSWDTCAAGGGGGGDSTLFDFNVGTNIITSDAASTTATTSITSSFFTAASTTGSSTLPRIASTVLGATTAYITNLFIGVDTLAEYIADTAGAMFSGNTETGVTVTYQDADNTVDVVCDTASSLTFGCLTAAFFNVFNEKVSTTSIDTEAELETLLTDVTNVFTNNDGALSDDDLTNNQIDDLSDVAALSETTGDVLSWNGSAWIDVATSTLGFISQSFYNMLNEKVSSTSLSWTDTSQIDGTYTPSTGVFTASIVANSIGDTQLAQDVNFDEATSTILSTTLLTATTSTSSRLFAGDATTTTFFSFIASTSRLYATGLADCGASNKITYSGGTFGCASDQTGGGGGSFPFSSDTNYGQTVYSTSTPTLWFKSGLFASSTSYFVHASATNLTARDLNGVKYANEFAGTDIGAKINAAYAAMDSAGGTIYVSPGSYTFSTPINFGTDLKHALLKCGPGTTFNYSGTATATILNYGYSSLRFGQGIDGCNYNSNNGTTSNHVAIQVGGTNGAQGSVISNLKINNFNKGIAGAANSWGVTYDHVLTQDTPYAFVQESYDNSGEAINFINTFFADSNWRREVEKCVWIQTSGAASFAFFGGALDNCGMTIEDGSYQVSFYGTHFENPFPSYYSRYRWIVNKGNASLVLNAPSFVQQGTVAGDVPDSYIANAGRLVINGGSFAQDAAGGAPAALINNYGSGRAEIYGLKQFGTAATVATSGISYLVDTANTLMTFSGTASSTISTSTQLFANQGTTTHWTIGSSINLFGGGSKTTANALCIQLTGDASLCDGSDATGGAGGVAADWQKETNFGALALTPTTTIPVWIKGALYASSTLFVDGNVSIGTSTTANKVSIFSAASSQAGLKVTGGSGSTATANANSGQILLGSGAAAAAGSLSYDWSLGDMHIDNTWNDNQGDIIFRTKTLGGTTTALAILGSGNVGVSTSSPFATLSVHKLAGTSGTSVFALASSTASATTTLFQVFNTGSTSIPSLASCDSVDTDANGFFKCGNDATGVGGGATFGQGWELNTSGQLAPTTTKVIAVNGVVATGTATSTFTGGVESIGFDANSFLTIGADTLSDITGTDLSIVAGALGITADSVGDTELAFNTGQNLTTTSDVQFAEATTSQSFATVASSTSLFTNAINLLNGVISSVGATITAGATAVLDFGSALSFEIPNAANPTVDATGEIALDTTDNDLVVGTSTSAAVVPTIQKIWGATIASTSVDFASGGRIWLPVIRDGYDMTEIHCAVDGGTSKVINISNSAGTADTETVTCDADAQSDTSIDTNSTFAAGATMSVEMGATTGTVDYVTFTVYGYKTRE